MKIKTKYNQDLLIGLKRQATHKVVLLHSAGVESTASGIVLKEKGFKVFPVCIDYGQSASKVEQVLVKKTSQILGFEEPRIITTDILSQLTKSKLLGQNAIDDSDAWVPGRNTLFMIIAGIVAKQINADGICLGYMIEDNFVFGDNDFFHHQSMHLVLSHSFLQPMKVYLPISQHTKKDLLKILRTYKVDQLTVSCWNPSIIHHKIVTCGKCANCQERIINI